MSGQPGRLLGKTAIVIGAGSQGEGIGNGRAVAIMFAREGAKVVAFDRDAGALDDTQKRIEAEGLSCRTIVGDVCDTEQIANAVRTCVDETGRLDVLHFNVGIVIPGGPAKISESDWDTVFRVNTTSFYLCCKHAVPVMEKQGGGSIVAISSISSIRYLGFDYTAYDASKAALNAIVRSVALTGGSRGIRANTIILGLMDTPLARQAIEAARRDVEKIYQNYEGRIPVGRMGVGWDTANAAVFLASDQSQYINGAELVVDGGISWRCL
jgi:NAD(P)-dependent dehydrogenase (short-subunit alcohol dehydrogenase family)